ncbi:MAG: DNA polymerase III subunit alpha, partial [Saezia sp.]
EEAGLVKFDFLGLATLTILEHTRQLILRNDVNQQDFDFAKLPLDDKAAYKLMSEGKTVSVFQLESRGMQGMLRDARPSVFEDIIALVALYRPGPMDLIPTFCARKHGREAVEYAHPFMEEILSETYGIMIYQEQVMQAAQKLGGYSLGGADLLRRAMGKKKPEEMEQHRGIFSEGAAKNGISKEKADEIFDLMEKFAGYGFNKSHAAAYALLAYYTAWAKVHYPAEFAASNMIVSIDDTDKLKIIYDDAIAMGLTFEPPDVNLGGYAFDPITPRSIRYGLGAIKGTGKSAVEAIVQAREEGGEFASLFDFCNRVGRRQLNKRTVEALIKAGAFDRIQLNRAALLASVELAFEYADQQAANVNQGGLFDMLGEAASDEEPILAEVKPWSIKERLLQEKEAIGFFISGHLFDEYEPEVRCFAKQKIVDVGESHDLQLIAGIVSDLRTIHGQRGKVTIFKLEDKSGSIEVVANEEVASQWAGALKDDELMLAQCKVSPDRFSGGLRANVNQLWSLPAARCRFGVCLKLEIEGDGIAPDFSSIIAQYPPQKMRDKDGTELPLGVKVRVTLRRSTFVTEIDLGELSRFYPSDAALGHWRILASQVKAKMQYAQAHFR